MSSFDRTVEDVGNVVLLEHVNVRVPDLMVATTFYVHALGCTRDPYIDHGPNLVWFNLGSQQFHVPKGDRADVLRGVIEIRVPSLAGLERRLNDTAEHLQGTQFSFRGGADATEVVGPWGNRFVCTEPKAAGEVPLGMGAVEFAVPTGATAGIARFYEEVLGAHAVVNDGTCEVSIGTWQVLRFVETDEPLAEYDGHHLAIYVADFSGPHRWLLERELVEQESNQHQYRFNWLTDPESGDRLFQIEHEVRSISNPLYQRPLINRNHEQRIMGYTPDADAFWPGDKPALRGDS